MMYEFVIRSLEALVDTLEYGPIEAVKINTSFCPEYDREVRRLEKLFSTNWDEEDEEEEDAIAEEEPIEAEREEEEKSLDEMEEFGIKIEKIKSLLCEESKPVNLGLLYDYNELNDYGKMVVEKISADAYLYLGGKDSPQHRKAAEEFKEGCVQGEGNKYEAIFWAFIVHLANSYGDGMKMNRNLSTIREFSNFLGINNEEMQNIGQLAQSILQS